MFELPLRKAVITEVEGNDEDGDPIYQHQKLHNYLRGKQYIKDHCVFLVERILKCYEERYWSETSVGEDASVVTTCDHLLLDVCNVLNCAVWPTLSEDDGDGEKLGVQLKSVAVVYNHFHEMDVLKKIEKETVTNGYEETVHYCQKFFNIENVDPIELWHNVLLVSKDKESWLGISLIIEICHCTPNSHSSFC